MAKSPSPKQGANITAISLSEEGLAWLEDNYPDLSLLEIFWLNMPDECPRPNKRGAKSGTENNNFGKAWGKAVSKVDTQNT